MSALLIWSINLILLALAVKASIYSDANVTRNALLNSDALYPYTFLNDVLRGAELSTWNPPRAPYFVPDLMLLAPVVLVGRLLGLTPIHVTALGSFLLGLSWSLVFAWFFHSLGGMMKSTQNTRDEKGSGPWSLAHIAPLATAAVFAAIWLGADNALLNLIFVPGFHTLCVLVYPTFFWMSLRVLRGRAPSFKQRIANAIGFVALLALTVASDVQFLLVAVLPLLFALPVLLRWRWTDLARVGAYIALLMISLLLVDHLRDALDSRLKITRTPIEVTSLLQANFWEKLTALPAELLRLTPAPMGILLMFSVVALLLSVWLQRKSHGIDLLMPGIQLGSLALSLFAAVVVSHQVYDSILIWRLVLPGLLLAYLLACHGLASLWSHRALRPQLAIGVAVFCSLLLSSALAQSLPVSSRYSVPGDLNRGTDGRAANLILAQCLERMQPELGRFGLGDYWTAKSVSYLSERRIFINQVTPNLAVHWWISNYEWYYEPHRHSNPGYQFVVMDRLIRADVLRFFGEPARVERCGPSEIFIYNRPGDERLRRYFMPESLDLWLTATGGRRPTHAE